MLLRAIKTLKVVTLTHTFLCDVLHQSKYRFKFITRVCGASEELAVRISKFVKQHEVTIVHS